MARHHFRASRTTLASATLRSSPQFDGLTRNGVASPPTAATLELRERSPRINGHSGVYYSNVNAESDAALSRRARGGDSEAFGVLIGRYMRRAYVHALGIVGSREDALDLSQEAFVRAYRARHTLDPDRAFYAWLYQILRRLCFNFLRDTKTRARLRETHAVDWVVGIAHRPDWENPAREAERAEERRRVSTAIQRLPWREREVLVLREFQELTYREIADLLEIPIGTVMSRLYAARKRLAESLDALR
jgi:RNA polymerase sigma-70 factor (ECF subfamily)